MRIERRGSREFTITFTRVPSSSATATGSRLLIGVPNTVWEALSQRIARETGIPAEYLLLAAVHDHSAPAPFGMYGNDSPKSASYTKQVEDATVEAIRKAKENLSEPKSGSGPEELT